MAGKITFVSFTFLLAVAPIVTMAISIPTATTGTLPLAPVDVPSLPLIPPEGEAPDAAADCWKAVVQAESCAVDILRWFASPELAAVRVGTRTTGPRGRARALRLPRPRGVSRRVCSSRLLVNETVSPDPRVRQCGLIQRVKVRRVRSFRRARACSQGQIVSPWPRSPPKESRA